MHPPAAQPLPPHPYNPFAWVAGQPEIGAGTWIGAFTLIDGLGGLKIGQGCNISSGAQILSHSTVRRCVTERRHPDVARRHAVALARERRAQRQQRNGSARRSKRHLGRQARHPLDRSAARGGVGVRRARQAIGGRQAPEHIDVLLS